MVGKQNFSKTAAAGSGRCSCFWYISADSAVLKKRANLRDEQRSKIVAKTAQETEEVALAAQFDFARELCL